MSKNAQFGGWVLIMPDSFEIFRSSESNLVVMKQYGRDVAWIKKVEDEIAIWCPSAFVSIIHKNKILHFHTPNSK